MSISLAAAASSTRVHAARHERSAAQDAAPAAQPSTGGVDASGRTMASSLSALLSHFDGTTGGSSTTAASAAEPDVTPSVKPNLDALKRVLAHYAAQTAAADTMVSLVRS